MTTGQQVTIRSGSYKTHGTVTRIDTVLHIAWVQTSLPYEKVFDSDTGQEIGGVGQLQEVGE